jgi:hypothetical protein
MARHTDTILGSQAWATGNENPQLDPAMGGQFGYAPNPGEWLSAQAYTPRNLIPIVLEAPRFFSLMPNSEKWVQAWKAFWEKHARVIEGLKAGLTVETAEHHFGGAGEYFEEFTDVKRERSTLSVSLVEKYGNVWQNFFERCIIYSQMHPETKTPMISTLGQDAPADLLADWYGGTVGFIEPDPTGARCNRMWISTNVWAKGTGPIEGKMDKTSALSIKELSLEFTSLTFINEGTRAYGQEILTGINRQWTNPQIRKAFIDSISADVAAAARGYVESQQSVADNRVGDLV